MVGRMTRLRRWAVAGAVLLVWSGLVDTGLVRHRALAGPIAIAHALIRGLADGTLEADVLATLLRVAAGTAVGLAIGLPLGLWSGSSPARRQALEPGLDFFRAVPPLLVFPLLLLAFGYNDGARIAAVAYATTLVISMHVASGVASASPARAQALHVMGASAWQRLRWLQIYEALPQLMTGLRHAVATGLVVAVVTEMVVGSPHGLGARAMSAQVDYDVASIYAVLLLAGACGFAATRLLLALERVTSWSE